MAEQQFSYVARDRTGTSLSGSIWANNQQEAMMHLRKQGLQPWRLQVMQTKVTTKQTVAPQGLLAVLQKPIGGTSGLRPKQLGTIVRQLSSLLKAGLPIDRSLALMMRIPKDGKTKEFIGRGYEQIRSGNSLSQAWQDGYMGFPHFGWSMLQAGEASGNLEESLDAISEVVEENAQLQSIIFTSVAYPLLLLVVSISLVIALVVYAVPQFESIFSLWGGQLPLATRVLVAASHWLQAWGKVLFGTVFAMVLAGMVWYLTPSGRYCFDSFCLRIPVLGIATRDAATARLFRTIGAMLKGGVPFSEALRISAGAASNTRLVRGIRVAADKVENGERLSQSLQRDGAFPHSIVELVGMG